MCTYIDVHTYSVWIFFWNNCLAYRSWPWSSNFYWWWFLSISSSTLCNIIYYIRLSYKFYAITHTVVCYVWLSIIYYIIYTNKILSMITKHSSFLIIYCERIYNMFYYIIIIIFDDITRFLQIMDMMEKERMCGVWG